MMSQREQLFLVLFEIIMNIQMHFESTKIDNSIITATSKKLGIILLTDNRNIGPFDRDIINDLKGSLCKETQVDSQQQSKGLPIYTYQDDIIALLTKRVTQLEEKVEALSKLEKSKNIIEKKLEKKSNKKNRRKFEQIVRDNVCPRCKKIYGSNTALKCHMKLKHSSYNNYSQSQ